MPSKDYPGRVGRADPREWEGRLQGGVPEPGRFIIQVREVDCTPDVSVIEASGQLILPSKN